MLSPGRQERKERTTTSKCCSWRSWGLCERPFLRRPRLTTRKMATEKTTRRERRFEKTNPICRNMLCRNVFRHSRGSGNLSVWRLVLDSRLRGNDSKKRGFRSLLAVGGEWQGTDGHPGRCLTGPIRPCNLSLESRPPFAGRSNEKSGLKRKRPGTGVARGRGSSP
jgi:hypothetical protein